MRNIWEIVKHGAEERLRRAAGPIVWEMEKYCIESRRRKIYYMQY